MVNWTTSFRTPEHVLDYWRTHAAVSALSSAELAPHFAWAEKRLCIAKVEEAAMNRNNSGYIDTAVSSHYYDAEKQQMDEHHQRAGGALRPEFALGRFLVAGQDEFRGG